MKIVTQDVVLAKQGDKEAFGRLYSSVAEDLYRFSLYTLGNVQDAEDAVSEAFVEAWKGIKGLRDENSFKPWIMRIISIRCKRRISLYIKGRNIDPLEEAGEVCDENGHHTLKAEVMEALDRLNVQERQIVILSVLHGYTIREIAEIMSCPQGTISSKLHRSLKKLRTMLE